MYKRLYLGREVPPDRHSHILDTHDIEGAQPKSWVHPDRPFFAKNYPEVHLATQNQQYNDALHQRLLYNKKQNEIEWKFSKKCDYPDAKAKNSEISREQLINRKDDYEDVKKAKELFFARNLRVDDIEGTKPGTLDTKYMKNWALAQEYKKSDAEGLRRKPGQSLDIFQKPRNPYPYGDGMNGEDYLPDNLKHAREMAHRNRNRLRAEATLNPNYHGRADASGVRADQRTSMGALIRGEPPSQPPYSQNLAASHPQLSMNPSSQPYTTAYQRTDANPHQQQQLQAPDQFRQDNELPTNASRAPEHHENYEVDERARELKRQIEEEEMRLQWIREELQKEKENSGPQGPAGGPSQYAQNSREQGGGWDYQNSNQIDPRYPVSQSEKEELIRMMNRDTRMPGPPTEQRSRHVYFEQQDKTAASSQQEHRGEKTGHLPQDQHHVGGSHPNLHPPGNPHPHTDFSGYGLTPKEQDHYFQPSVLNNPPREMFANQLEQAKYER